MDTDKTTIYQVIRNFLIASSSIDEDEKTKYLTVLDDLGRGKMEDVETLDGLNKFLEEELRQLEDASLVAEDTEQIDMLADLRNARLGLQKQLLGVAGF